ncbi:MAG: hypothetical protein UY71_C0001G0012 [Parcubacteria group bacterium GW2011_GWB1_52_7]|nr:MAG: hypothetical protein UY64_C0024G0005 [Parcubacteria group bacterium GW2011_GWA1_51_12]KKW29202.1 MAG: hypothetical protein UY71_C0001G0012 [Parcubacteria group bacterium GW2011_GWB1_52_7]KKW31029.1 MAG: hypothetical protein UY75_C0017G0007 [Parcubacteria group bacterium GW2011_GWC2_52_8c]
MKQKVIIVRSLNFTPEDELENRLQELGKGWRVVSASTSLALHGTMDYRTETSWMNGIARHAYYVTTVIVERAP